MLAQLETSKAKYFDAVVDALIKNYDLTKQKALELIDAYKLALRLEQYPEEQMHYDVDDIADEIMQECAVSF